MAKSQIEWTEVTWNPVTGCDRVSTGRDHCYPLTLANRLKASGAPKDQADGDPYYPVPRPENAALYKRYLADARAAQDVWFAGRLATYRYYNMDQVVGQALSVYERIRSGASADVPA